MTTVFSHINLNRFFTSSNLTTDRLQMLTMIGATIVDFRVEVQKNTTHEQIIKLLKNPKYKQIIEQILNLEPGVITAINIVSKTFFYPTVVVHDIEIPIVFLQTVNGKPISFEKN